MKKFIPLLFVILLIGCNKKTKSDKIWSVDYDTVSSHFYMKEINSQKAQTITQVIEMLNEKNPEIQLELNKTSNDTVYVKIEDSEYLTQQCGTSGAASYLSSVIYNLSEFEIINYINFDFEVGDHAMPGTYSRNDSIMF